VSAGLVEAKDDKITEREKMLNQLLHAVPNPLGDVRLDAYTFYYGLEYMKKNKPRVMYFAFDETDDFAHGGEYAAYLNAAHYTDRFIDELWNYVQSDPQYKDKTTLIMVCDHGRGITSEEWKHHGTKIEHADEIWLGVMGPDTPATGEVKTDSQYYQNQMAKTLASFLGLDFRSDAKIGDALTAAIKK
jgi:phosphoglycerol transferase MdoB-like AlkP superfamily enzyme